MTPYTEKIPDDFQPELVGWGKVLAWFMRRGLEPLWRRLRWRRVAAALVGLALAGYLALAGAAYGFVRGVRGIEAARFFDVALPWRWDHYRVARGDQQLAEAKVLVEQGKFSEALPYALNGVASSPANRDGRLLLVDLRGAARQLQFARETLLEGLLYHATDPVYLKPVLTFLLRQQDDAYVVALAVKYLATAGPETARLLALAAATAGFFRGNYDQAEDFLRAVPGLAASRDGRFLASKLECDRGYRDLALVRLRQLAAELPHDAEVHRELVMTLRAQGLADEARRANLAFQIAHPSLAGPRIELLTAYREAGETTRLAREQEALLRDFPADAGALLALADFAANGGDVAFVKRLSAHAETRQLDAAPFVFLAVEAALVAKDYRGAIGTIRASLTEREEWAQRYRALFDSLTAIAQLGLGDATSARASLDSFLTPPNLRADNLLAVANRFAALGGAAQAWQTLARAVELDPLNQAAFTRLIELDLELGRMEELAVHLRSFVKVRRPSPAVLHVVHYRLGSDVWLFAQDVPLTLEIVRTALTRVAEGGWR